MVVFPLPVGPLTITMPNGDCTMREYRSLSAGDMPSSLSRKSERVRSSSRITVFSPQIVEVVETRTSRWRPSMFISSWPSCGRRRSTMFMSAMILMRLTSAGPMSAGSESTSCSAPSMRKRTRTSSSVGSMWTSDARSRSACVRILFTTWMTGASSTIAAAAACSCAVCSVDTSLSLNAAMSVVTSDSAR